MDKTRVKMVSLKTRIAFNCAILVVVTIACWLILVLRCRGLREVWGISGPQSARWSVPDGWWLVTSRAALLTLRHCSSARMVKLLTPSRGHWTLDTRQWSPHASHLQLIRQWRIVRLNNTLWVWNSKYYLKWNSKSWMTYLTNLLEFSWRKNLPSMVVSPAQSQRRIWAYALVSLSTTTTHPILFQVISIDTLLYRALTFKISLLEVDIT